MLNSFRSLPYILYGMFASILVCVTHGFIDAVLAPPSPPHMGAEMECKDHTRVYSTCQALFNWVPCLRRYVAPCDRLCVCHTEKTLDTGVEYAIIMLGGVARGPRNLV